MHSSALHNLGVALRSARNDAGLTIRSAQALCGINRSTIARLEAGSLASPRAEQLQALARAYRVDAESFYALIGLKLSPALPELAPYLRAKYHLSPSAITELDHHLQTLRDDAPPRTARNKETPRDGDATD